MQPMRLLLPGSRSNSQQLGHHDDRTNPHELHVGHSTEHATLDVLQEQLHKVLATLSEQASTIKTLNDDIIRQHMVVDDLDAENEELISDMQDLIVENENLIKELTASKAARRNLDVANQQLKSENFMLMEKLEKKRLGCIEESEVEELKRQTREPLVRKLEVSREEAKLLEERMKWLDAERDGLAEQLTKAVEKSSQLSVTVTSMQQTIDDLKSSFLQVWKENSALKMRLKSFDHNATFRDIALPQILQQKSTPAPEVQLVKTGSNRQRKSILEMIPAIPSYLFSSKESVFPNKETKQDLKSKAGNNGRRVTRASVVGVISTPYNQKLPIIAPPTETKLQRASISQPQLPLRSDSTSRHDSVSSIKPSRRRTVNSISSQDFRSSNGVTTVQENQKRMKEHNNGEDTKNTLLSFGDGEEESGIGLADALSAVQDLYNLGELGDMSDEEVMGEDEKHLENSVSPSIESAKLTNSGCSIDDKSSLKTSRKDMLNSVHSMNKLTRVKEIKLYKEEKSSGDELVFNSSVQSNDRGEEGAVEPSAQFVSDEDSIMEDYKVALRRDEDSENVSKYEQMESEPTFPLYNANTAQSLDQFTKDVERATESPNCGVSSSHEALPPSKDELSLRHSTTENLLGGRTAHGSRPTRKGREGPKYSRSVRGSLSLPRNMPSDSAETTQKKRAKSSTRHRSSDAKLSARQNASDLNSHQDSRALSTARKELIKSIIAKYSNVETSPNPDANKCSTLPPRATNSSCLSAAHVQKHHVSSRTVLVDGWGDLSCTSGDTESCSS